MHASEFDRFAEEYEALHRANVRISGEEPEFFAAYKIAELEGSLERRGAPRPRSILDFGCGIGNSIVHLRRHFPDAEIVGADVSGRSVEIARARFGDLAEFTLFDGATLPFAPHRFDVAFSACVFHHIGVAEHLSLLAEIRRILREHGTVAIFEHNPINPLTVYTVKTCPFDENARLIRAGTMLGRLAEAGFSALERRYCLFFPRFLRMLRRFEPQLSWCPAGAQYYILGRR
jgi:SAM-dependent methyltransferase